MVFIEVSIAKQELYWYENDQLVKKISISTAKQGSGETRGSEQTPRGLHMIRAKIGHGCPVNTVFVGRRPTGELYTPELRGMYPDRDWILTRILWLSGLEIGKNRLGNVDTMRRYIYIHGTPDDVELGVPGSRGCIRVQNNDMINLFDNIPFATQIQINE